MLISENSPLRLLPLPLSRKQILVFDGIRYAAEMTDLASRRLFGQLEHLSVSSAEPSTQDIATAMLDAWSIIDSVNRFRDLLQAAPGVRNEPWKRLLWDRTAVAGALRNCAQHQTGEIEKLIANRQQLWGYLSWAGFQNGSYTGKWHMMSAGTHFSGTKWYTGPAASATPLPFGRIRLNTFGERVYLGLLTTAVRDAVRSIEEDLTKGSVRLVGSPVEGRGGPDFALETMIIIEYTVNEQEKGSS